MLGKGGEGESIICAQCHHHTDNLMMGTSTKEIEDVGEVRQQSNPRSEMCVCLCAYECVCVCVHQVVFITTLPREHNIVTHLIITSGHHN